jgi:hypothetical protein
LQRHLSLSAKVRGPIRIGVVWLLLLLVVLGLQWWAGSFTAEFSGYPDEASHYISGLLVRDYVAGHFPAPPMRFAQDFYLHYPYLAIGHWPPLFYLIEGLWMLLFSPSRISIVLLSVLITAAFVVSAYEVLRRHFGHLPALTSALLLAFVPLVQKYAGMVLMDTLLAVLSFWAVLYFGRFLDTGSVRDSIKFGALACLAIITKGNGLDLALVPPIAVLLTRRFYLLRRSSFWLPAVMVSLVCLPWHLLTMHLMLPTFMDSAGLDFTKRTLSFYSLLLLKSVGPAILALMIVGFFARIVRPFAERLVEARWAAAAAFVLSICIFHCTVPAGIEARYFIAALPPLFMFFVAGADYLARRLAIAAVKPGWRLEFLILLAALVFAWTSFAIPKKASYGLREAVKYLMSRPEFKDSLSLVSSETASGEGIFISEVAMGGRRNEHAILRANKVLADDDWNLQQYKPRYPNARVLMGCLEQIPIRFIVLDMSAAPRHLEHHRQLLAIVRDRYDRWKLVGTFGGDAAAGRGPIEVYRSVEYDKQPMPRGGLPTNITTNVGGTLQHWPFFVKMDCQPDPASARETK